MLEQIKKGIKLGKETLTVQERDWLIQQAEKSYKLEDSIDYVLSAKVEHYRDAKHMLEDFKLVICMSDKN